MVVCRKLEEDVGLLQLQLHQRDSDLVQLQQQVGHCATFEGLADLHTQPQCRLKRFASEYASKSCGLATVLHGLGWRGTLWLTNAVCRDMLCKAASKLHVAAAAEGHTQTDHNVALCYTHCCQLKDLAASHTTAKLLHSMQPLCASCWGDATMLSPVAL